MNDYITRQKDPAIASLPYGRLKKTVDHVGCGLVAVYNVMLRLGQPQAFEDVVRDAQRLRLPWLFGVFGTKPWALTKYFREKGVPCTRTNDCEAWQAALQNCRAAILCTWNDKRRHGIHFYAVVNENGSLYALNRYSNCDHPTPYAPTDARKDRFITGLIFE